MRDLLSAYDAFVARGERIGRAVVTRVFGSAPLPEGATLLATTGGAIAGSVSGGCVEGATATAIVEAISRGTAESLTFQVSDETAWEVGLACGGTIELLVEPRVAREVLDAARGSGGVVVATVVGGAADPPGSRLVVGEDGKAQGPFPPEGADPAVARAAAGKLGSIVTEVVDRALDALARESSRTERVGRTGATADENAGHGGDGDADVVGLDVFLEVFPRPPRLVIFGGVHVAAALVPMARALGYRTVVADGRRAFLTRERFPDADELILAWPDEAFAKIGLDRSTYVCVLSHDPKFDEPALLSALHSPAAYVGAIGSRKTQAARRARLAEAGLTEAELDRLRGPIGLDLGGRRPAETALAILAEMTAVRYGGTGRPMREAARARHAGGRGELSGSRA